MARRKRPGRSRRSVTIGLLVLASITIITLDYRGGGQDLTNALKRGAHDTFAPIQSGVNAVVRPIGSFLAGAVHYGSLEQQNAKIRHELGVVQQQLLQSQSANQTVATLTRLEHLPWVGSVPTVTAQVVGLSTSDFASTVQLNVGSRSGAVAGMPVVGGSGLVGTVTEVWSSGCTVQLISDPASTVGVRFATSTYAETKGGGFGKPLSVNYIFPGTRGLYRGEVLVTSGLPNAAFPANIPVARIKSFSSTRTSTQVTVSAEPVADLSALQYVDVMLWEPSQ
jgi:rod shape-determining protein MreC